VRPPDGFGLLLDGIFPTSLTKATLMVKNVELTSLANASLAFNSLTSSTVKERVKNLVILLGTCDPTPIDGFKVYVAPDSGVENIILDASITAASMGSLK
jgi:hypothetical protein